MGRVKGLRKRQSWRCGEHLVEGTPAHTWDSGEKTFGERSPQPRVTVHSSSQFLTCRNRGLDKGGRGTKYWGKTRQRSQANWEGEN